MGRNRRQTTRPRSYPQSGNVQANDQEVPPTKAITQHDALDHVVLRAKSASEQKRDVQVSKLRRLGHFCFGDSNRAIATGTIVMALVTSVYAIVSGLQLGVLRQQLSVMVSEQKPNVVIINPGQPVFQPLANDNNLGTVLWNVVFINSGKSTAKKFSIFDFMKKESGSYEPSFGTNPMKAMKTEFPAGSNSFITVLSTPGVRREFFNQAMQEDRIFGIKINFQYADEYGSITESSFCYERLATGALANIDPSECKETG